MNHLPFCRSSSRTLHFALSPHIHATSISFYLLHTLRPQRTSSFCISSFMTDVFFPKIPMACITHGKRYDVTRPFRLPFAAGSSCTLFCTSRSVLPVDDIPTTLYYHIL